MSQPGVSLSTKIFLFPFPILLFLKLKVSVSALGPDTYLSVQSPDPQERPRKRADSSAPLAQLSLTQYSAMLRAHGNCAQLVSYQ